MLMLMMLIIRVIYDHSHAQQKLCIRPGFSPHSPIIGELKKSNIIWKQLPSKFLDFHAIQLLFSHLKTLSYW